MLKNKQKKEKYNLNQIDKRSDKKHKNFSLKLINSQLLLKLDDSYLILIIHFIFYFIKYFNFSIKPKLLSF